MTASPLIFPKRTIHLDFHTGPDIPDVGADFNADSFAATFAEAHVDSVTVFAKCHHGHLYYNTSHPARHPGLKPGLDLLSEQVEALHRRGIRAPIYLSVQCDEYAANAHPEWIALDDNLRQIKDKDLIQAKWKQGALKADWQILDMSSPYQDYLADQLDEVLRKFAPTDGIFLDMCWDQPSYSKWAFDGMRKASLDPASESDRALYARQVAHQYMARFYEMVEKAHRNHPPAGIWFNSRPKTNLQEEKKYLRHIEIESLPTGGWGYAYFPYVSRFVRPLNMPTLSHTGRFFCSWGDHGSLKPEMALKYECAQILSQTMTSGVGDLLPPRGVPQPAAYDLIGRVYAHIQACEPFVEGGKLLSDIAVIIDPALGDNPGPAGLGMVRMLTQLQQQFDLLAGDTSVDLSLYRVVIVPANTPVDEGLQQRLQTYVAGGGALILSGSAGLGADGQPWLAQQQIDMINAEPQTDLFLHPADDLHSDLPSHFDQVMPEAMIRLAPRSEATVLAFIGEPYFQRRYDHFSGHSYTPEQKVTRDAAVVEGQRVITFACPIFAAYANHPTPWFRQLFAACLERLLPSPLLVADGPSRMETTVVKTDDHLVIHVMSFDCERRSLNLDVVEDAIPLVEMPLALRCEKQPSRITLQPHGKVLPCEYRDGYVHTRITLLDGHGLVVVE